MGMLDSLPAMSRPSRGELHVRRQQVLGLPMPGSEGTVVDLFAGAGGFSEAARLAGLHVSWAGNHSPLAVEWHKRAHPETFHLCQDLHQANWSKVPAHEGMLAAPCCQGHSPSRGKEQEHHDASRSTAWAVVSCAERHRPKWFVVENVPEFLEWTLYPSFADALQRLGYSLAPHVLNAADYGVAQERVRLILVGTRSRAPLKLNLEQEPMVPAAAILEDDAAVRWSPIQTPRRAPATLARIERGRRAFGSRFLIPYYGSGSGRTGRSLARPLGVVTTRARWALVDGDRMRMLTVREYTRAMSFREDYPLPEVQADAIQLLGNAVCPKLAQKVIRAVREAA